jgi:hypothetical protein
MPPKTPNPNVTEHERKEKKKINFFSENWGITVMINTNGHNDLFPEVRFQKYILPIEEAM